MSSQQSAETVCVRGCGLFPAGMFHMNAGWHLLPRGASPWVGRDFAFDPARIATEALGAHRTGMTDGLAREIRDGVATVARFNVPMFTAARPPTHSSYVASIEDHDQQAPSKALYVDNMRCERSFVSHAQSLHGARIGSQRVVRGFWSLATAYSESYLRAIMQLVPVGAYRERRSKVGVNFLVTDRARKWLMTVLGARPLAVGTREWVYAFSTPRPGDATTYSNNIAFHIGRRASEGAPF